MQARENIAKQQPVKWEKKAGVRYTSVSWRADEAKQTQHAELPGLPGLSRQVSPECDLALSEDLFDSNMQYEGLPLHQAFSSGSGMTDLMALVMSDDELPAKVTLPVQASSAQWLPWIGVTTGLTQV